MDKRTEQKIFQRRHTNGKHVNEDVLDVSNHQGNAHGSHNDIAPYTYQNDQYLNGKKYKCCAPQLEVDALERKNSCSQINKVQKNKRLCLNQSYPLQFKYFHTLPMCRSYSRCLWISFRGNCSMCCCTMDVSIGRVEFRNLLCFNFG